MHLAFPLLHPLFTIRPISHRILPNRSRSRYNRIPTGLLADVKGCSMTDPAQTGRQEGSGPGPVPASSAGTAPPPPPPAPVAPSAAPVCARHPDRETWVKCGRCNKPLCPDCVMHGPVGVRCRECLLPQGRGTGLVGATQMASGARAGVGIAAVSLVVLVLVGWLSTSQYAEIWTPNLLLSAAVGGVIGWTIWRACRRTYNAMTVRTATLLAVAVPLLAAAMLAGILVLRGDGYLLRDVISYLRILASAGLSAFMAWLLATNTSA